MLTRLRILVGRLLRQMEGALRRAREHLEPRSQLWIFTAGKPEEWADFERRRRPFLQRFASLRDAINVGLTKGTRFGGSADLVLFFLCRLSLEDFLEILLLAANGYGFGATKLLRGMYERVVTARYLMQHPEETDAFLAWGVVSSGKAAREVLETFGGSLSAEARAKLAERIARDSNERDRFMVTDCKKCKTKRLNHTWTQLTFVSMARQVGGGTGNWIFPCYLEPLRHGHATAGALEARVHVREGVVTFDAGPSRKEADTALMFAHMLTLNVLDLVHEHFKPDDLEAALEKACQDYKAIWDLPAAEVQA